jgi:hypothetical protein
VQVLGCGVGCALEGGCAEAEGGLADEGAQVLGFWGGAAGRGGVVCGCDAREGASGCGAQEGRLGEEVLRHFRECAGGWEMVGLGGVDGMGA